MGNKVNRSSNKKKSLCEKSMKIMVNILKMSSLSLARVSLGTTTTATSTTGTAPTRASSTGNHGYSSSSTNLGSNVVGVPAAAPTVPRDYPARLIKISQQPENSSKRSTSSYLVDPNVGNESSSYVVKQQVGSSVEPMNGKNNEKVSSTVEPMNGKKNEKVSSTVEPMNGKKNEKVSSTVEPMNGKKNEKVSVDNRASNYIRRFHEKNRKDPNSISKSFSSSYIILPPPPPPARIK